MPYVVGVVLAVGMGLFASALRLDRDRAFYPTVMIVIATYYALFAVMGGSLRALGFEALPIAAFVGASVAGFRRSLWVVVAALVAHGVFDLAHPRLIPNPGVPSWWPPFCLAFDLAAGGYLALRLRRNRLPA